MRKNVLSLLYFPICLRTIPFKDQFHAYENNKLRFHFFATINDDANVSDEAESNVKGTIGHIMTHFIQINNWSSIYGSCEKYEKVWDQTHSHLCTVGDANDQAGFTSRPTNSAMLWLHHAHFPNCN